MYNDIMSVVKLMANMEEMFTKDEMYDANRYLSSESLLKNPRIALYNVMKNVQKVYEFRSEALTDEVVDYVINNNLQFPDHEFYLDYVLYNYKLAYYLVKKKPSILYKVPEINLTEDLILMALNEGFNLENVCNKLISNQVFIKLAVIRKPQILNFVKKENITDEIIKIASSMKYVFEFVGDREGKYLTNTSWGEDNYDPPKNNLYLLNNDELVISSFVNGYESIIFEEYIPSENKYYDYMLNKALTDRIPITNLRNTELLENDAFKNYLNENLFVTEQSRELMNKYLKGKYITGNFELVSYILKDEFVETFGLLMADMIMKYLVCPKAEFKLDVVLKRVSEKTLKNIFDNLIDKNGKHILLQIQDIVNYLASNLELLKNISNFNNEEIKKLRFIMLENNSNIKINNKGDLNNIDDIRYEYYNSTDFNIKDKVFQFLTGKSNKDFQILKLEKITSLRYKRLINKANFSNAEDKKIIDYLEYLEEIDYMTDEELLSFWLGLKSDNFKLCLLDDIIKSFRNRFFDYYKLNLTKIRGQKPSYVENDIPVFEYNGQEFSFFIHAFNSFDMRYYEKFEPSFMFKNTIGRSYISTSYINEKHYKGVSPKQNNLIFIFEDFSYENFIACKDDDIYTYGDENNTFAVSTHTSSYLDIFEMACHTSYYNEFSFYRINNNGYRSLPSAVFCYDEIDDYSKSFAKMYQLPIVLIKTEMYKDVNENLFNKYLEEVNNGNISHIEELFGLSFKIFKKFTKEELVNIFDKFSNEDVWYLYKYLEMFGYDVHVLNSAHQKYLVNYYKKQK